MESPSPPSDFFFKNFRNTLDLYRLNIRILEAFVENIRTYYLLEEFNRKIADVIKLRHKFMMTRQNYVINLENPWRIG